MAPRKPTQRHPAERDELLAELDEELARREIETDAARKREIAEEAEAELFSKVVELLDLVAKGTPESPTCDKHGKFIAKPRLWAGRILELAEAWKAYPGLYTGGQVPDAGEAYGYRAARIIFSRGCLGIGLGPLAEYVREVERRLRRFGEDVYLKDINESSRGLGDYFELVSWEFQKSGGDLWKRGAGVLPGRKRLKRQVMAASPGAKDTARVELDDFTEPTPATLAAPPGEDELPVVPSPSTTDRQDREIACADDGVWLVVGTDTFQFPAGNQSRTVRALFSAWEKSGRRDGCGMSEAAIGEAIGSNASSFRVYTTLTNKGIRRYVRQVRRGVYAFYLNNPDSAPPE